MPSAQHVGQVAAVEPFAHQDGARGVGEAGLEQPQVAALEAGELGRAHLGDHRGHLAGRQLRDGLHVAAVFVAERDVGEQVLDRREALGFEHGGARGADAFDVGEWGGEIHGYVQGPRSAIRGSVIQSTRYTVDYSCPNCWRAGWPSLWESPTSGAWLMPSPRHLRGKAPPWRSAISGSGRSGHSRSLQRVERGGGSAVRCDQGRGTGRAHGVVARPGAPIARGSALPGVRQSRRSVAAVRGDQPGGLPAGPGCERLLAGGGGPRHGAAHDRRRLADYPHLSRFHAGVAQLQRDGCGESFAGSGHAVSGQRLGAPARSA